MSNYPLGGEPPVNPQNPSGIPENSPVNPQATSPQQGTFPYGTPVAGTTNVAGEVPTQNVPVQQPAQSPYYGAQVPTNNTQPMPQPPAYATQNPNQAQPVQGYPNQQQVGAPTQNYTQPSAYPNNGGYGPSAPTPQMVQAGLYPQKKKSAAPKVILVIVIALVVAGIAYMMSNSGSGSSKPLFGGDSLTTINGYIINHQDSKLQEYINNNPNADLDEFEETEFSPVYTAIDSDNTKALEILLTAGADPNLTDTYGAESYMGSPLFFALGNEKTDAVKILLAHGADVNKATSKGFTPLMSSIYNKNLDEIVMLEEAGANVDAEDQYSWSMLHYAAAAGDEELYEHFVEKGLSEDHLDSDGYNMVHAAFLKDHLDMAEYLMARGIPISTDSVTNGNTLLHLAGGKKTIQYVLDNYDIDVNSVNKNGETALSYNSDLVDADSIKLLLEAGSDPNMQDNNGGTALMYATGSKYADEIIPILLEYGADTSLKNSKGYTAYDYGEDYVSAETLRKLKPSLTA